MIISLIVAMGENRSIGRNNQLLWHLPNDLKWFKTHTWGKPIVMGRKTYESIGKPLPGRHNIVVTRNFSYEAPGCTVVTSYDEALNAAGEVPEVMVIGGAQLFALALPKAKRLYLTDVKANFDADVFFPQVDRTQWQPSLKEEHAHDDKNPFDYVFSILEKQ